MWREALEEGGLVEAGEGEEKVRGWAWPEFTVLMEDEILKDRSIFKRTLESVI